MSGILHLIFLDHSWLQATKVNEIVGNGGELLCYLYLLLVEWEDLAWVSCGGSIHQSLFGFL